LPLSQLLDLEVDARFPAGREVHLVEATLAADNLASLICWDHEHIPSIASHIPLSGPARPPATWPDDRFDLVWSFARMADGTTYAFSVIAQRLLAGDAAV
jgi:hypothetical protein